MDQNLGQARQLFHEIGLLLKLDGQTPSEKTFAGASLDDVRLTADFTLLMASLKRADGQIADSKALIQLVERVFTSRHLPLPSQFFLQKGITALIEGDYSVALDLFVQAAAGATSSLEKICAQSNTIYCLENLGLSFEAAMKELDRLFSEVPAKAFADFRSLYEALKMRLAFRKGFIPEIFESRKETRVSQATHFRFWMSELPFHRFFGAFSAEEKERYFLQNPHLFQKSYRLRTLQGIVHPSDLETFRESDYCDRLYLWTWRWLSDPELCPLEKILALLQNTTLQTLSPRLTSEDRQMLRNSLLWISLFVPSQAPAFKKLAQALCRDGSQLFPYFEFEGRLIEYLSALQQNEKSLASTALKRMKGHPLWESKDLHLSSLALSVTNSDTKIPEELKLLSTRLRQTCTIQKRIEKDKLYVDLIGYRLLWNGGRERVISEPMCLGIDLLYRKECVEYQEFVLVCFGFRHFDSFIHNAKIYNLIARIKRCLPNGLSIKTKNGRIYALGDWKLVEFERPAGCEEVVQRQTEWRHLLLKEMASKKESAPKAMKPTAYLAETGKKILSRKELEALTGKSRSSANRLIAEWIEQGVVKRIGQAKNTKYLLLSEQGIEAAAF